MLAGQLTGVGVDATGKVHRDEQPGPFGRQPDQLGGIVAQATRAADPEEPVDDEIGGRNRTHRPVRHRPTGTAKGGEPVHVGPLRPNQDRIHTGPPPRESSPGEQRVTAVVPGADEQGDPSAVGPAQQQRAAGGQARCSPLHQGTRRKLGHQRRLRGTDVPDRMGADHGLLSNTTTADAMPAS